MALAAVGFAKAAQRRQIMVATSSIGPGALNMVTAAGVAHANRLPVLLLPGDTFASRLPDPVLQQVEHFGDPTITVNDAFKSVSRYWDRIMRPEQIIHSLPHAVAMMLDPADCGPAVLALPQDVQAEAFDFPDEFFETTVHHIARPRADIGQLERAVAALRSAERPLIIAGGGVHYSQAAAELAAFAEAHGIPVVETTAGRTVPAGDAPAQRRARRRDRLHERQRARRRGRCDPRRRNAAAGLHHRLVDGLRRRRSAHRAQRRRLRCRQAPLAARRRRCPRRPARAGRALDRLGRRRRVGAARQERHRRLPRLHRRDRRPGGARREWAPDVRPGDRRRRPRPAAARLRARRRRRASRAS